MIRVILSVSQNSGSESTNATPGWGRRFGTPDFVCHGSRGLALEIDNSDPDYPFFFGYLLNRRGFLVESIYKALAFHRIFCCGNETICQ